jgi:hypothetical protein
MVVEAIQNMERKLDRLVSFDERSRDYPIRALIDTTVTPRSYTWGCDIYNDQGQEGACVGFSWSHELAAKPKVIPTDNAYALRIYHRAQQLDEWPGEDYDGSSVLAGAKAVQEIKNSLSLPLLGEYRWAFGTDDLIFAIGYKGPAVLGINWWTNMWEPQPDGFLHVDGEIAGGHAILCRGVRLVKKDTALPMTIGNVDRFKSYFLLHNSWGQGWGNGGTAKVRVQGMDKLLADSGEACIPVLRRAA